MLLLVFFVFRLFSRNVMLRAKLFVVGNGQKRRAAAEHEHEHARQQKYRTDTYSPPYTSYHYTDLSLAIVHRHSFASFVYHLLSTTIWREASWEASEALMPLGR